MKKTKIKTIIAAAILCLGYVTVSNAQSREDRAPKERPTFANLLEEMDANDDGKLAKDEVKGPLKEFFAKVDADEDGYITEEEFKNAPKPERRGKRENK